jgi:hypothetical protein
LVSLSVGNAEHRVACHFPIQEVERSGQGARAAREAAAAVAED